MSHFEGGCRCGGIRYTVAAAPYETRLCYCRDCQYASGSAFSVVSFFAKDRVSFSGKAPTSFAVTGSMGLTVKRSFCPDCGTPLYSEVVELPALICIKTGSLDDPSEITPTGEMWCDSKLSWLDLKVPGEMSPQNPPMDKYLPTSA